MEVEPGIISLLARTVELQKIQDSVFLLKVTWTDPETAYKLVQSILESYLANITKPLLEQNRVKQNFLLAQLEKKQAELAEVENQLARIEKENGITVLANQVLVDDAYQYRRRQDLADVLKNHRLLQLKRDAVNQDVLEISRLVTALDIDRALVDSINFHIIDPPVVPSAKSSPSLQLNLAVAGFFGLLIGIILTFFLEYLQNYRKDRATSSSM